MNQFGGWINNSQVLLVSRSNYGGFDNRFFVLDVDTEQIREIDVPHGVQLGHVSSNPSLTRTVVVLLLPDYGSNYSCDIYLLEGDRLSAPIVHAPDFDCEGLAWNGDDQFFHGRSTGPHGRINVEDVSGSGYYVLLSVYRYDLATGADEPVLVSDGHEVYRFGGVLPGRGLVVSNENAKRDPRYQLEIRDLKGRRPRVLASSRNEMLFIGWFY